MRPDITMAKPVEKFVRGFLFVGLAANVVVVILLALGVLKAPKRIISRQTAEAQIATPEIPLRGSTAPRANGQ